MLAPPEMLLIAGLVVLLFGARKLPRLARSLGRSKGEFSKGLSESEAERTGTEIDVTDANADDTEENI